MAAGRTIPVGMTLDHSDGCTTNNYIGNLRCVSGEINSRDGGFLRMLRNRKINPACIERAYLLRYFDRMAEIKASIGKYRYERLTKEQLRSILFLPDEDLQPTPLRLPLKVKTPLRLSPQGREDRKT